LLDYAKQDGIHEMEAGRLSRTVGMEIVDALESGGCATRG